ncbi:hypothetical protein V8G54_019022 [Vigna mungo]|uniref:Uncharacterized protein n=1 Tax=Vigna mungo TaxID=3915 RepID=A0AAQ3NB91_VIGMU
MSHHHNHNHHRCSSIIREKSSKHTNPSPFLSTPSIMRRHSSNVHSSSPIALNTRSNSSAEILPSRSVSNTAKASLSSSGSDPDSGPDPMWFMRASTVMQPPAPPSTSLSMSATSDAPRRVRIASRSWRETTPSLSRSIRRKAWARSHRTSTVTSDQSPEAPGRTLVGVREPAALGAAGLWTESSEEEDPKEGGSDRDKDRSFLERKRCFGLSLRFLGLMLMSFIMGD